MKFGFLSTLESLILPYMVNYAINEKIKNISIFLDAKGISDKNKFIWMKRTGGLFGDFKSPNNSLFKIKNYSIPFYFVDNHNSIDAIKLYKKLKIDCLFNAGTPRKISNEVLNLDAIPQGVVNIHPGILPQYRGCSSVEWAILNDDPIGNCVHFMDKNYDTGPIICDEKYNFVNEKNYIDIRNKVYLSGCKLAAKALKKIQIGEINIHNAQKQDDNIARYWDPTPKELEDKAIEKANQRMYKFQLNLT